jgi:hypothetical protein
MTRFTGLRVLVHETERIEDSAVDQQSFETRDELLDWMAQRPAGKGKLSTVLEVTMEAGQIQTASVYLMPEHVLIGGDKARKLAVRILRDGWHNSPPSVLSHEAPRPIPKA